MTDPVPRCTCNSDSIPVVWPCPAHTDPNHPSNDYAMGRKLMAPEFAADASSGAFQAPDPDREGDIPTGLEPLVLASQGRKVAEIHPDGTWWIVPDITLVEIQTTFHPLLECAAKLLKGKTDAYQDAARLVANRHCDRYPECGHGHCRDYALAAESIRARAKELSK